MKEQFKLLKAKNVKYLKLTETLLLEDFSNWRHKKANKCATLNLESLTPAPGQGSPVHSSHTDTRLLRGCKCCVLSLGFCANQQPQQIRGSKMKATSAHTTDLIKIYLQPPFVGKEWTVVKKRRGVLLLKDCKIHSKGIFCFEQPDHFSLLNS